MEKKVLRIGSPFDAVNLLDKWKSKKQENFLAITLNAAHEVIKIHHVTKGLVNRTLAHPRECFFPVIKDLATAVIFAHNHPSGNVYPSNEDLDCANTLNMAGQILGIKILDHLIITEERKYYSFRENDKIIEKFEDKEIKAFVAEVSSNNIKDERDGNNN